MGENEKKPSPPGGGYYKKKWNGHKKKQHGPSKPTVWKRGVGWESL